MLIHAFNHVRSQALNLQQSWAKLAQQVLRTIEHVTLAAFDICGRRERSRDFKEQSQRVLAFGGARILARRQLTDLNDVDRAHA